MTYIYDIEDHIQLLIRIKGTIWPDVLPFCLLTTFLSYLMFYLGDNGYHIALDKQGHGYLSILLSFLVVARINIAYARLWEANTHLKAALGCCKNLCSWSKILAGKDNSPLAQIWRDNIRLRLIALVRGTLLLLKDESKVVNIALGRGEKKEHRFGDLRRISSSVQILEPYELALRLKSAIQTEDTHLERKLHFLEKNSCMVQVSKYMFHFSVLSKFATTPIPFPVFQMARTVTLFWLFTLPLVLPSIMTKPNVCAICIFFITYGFLGLEMVAIELHDPFGDDLNDLEIGKFVDSMCQDIDDYFDEDITEHYNHDWDTPLPLDCGIEPGCTGAPRKIKIQYFNRKMKNVSFHYEYKNETTPLLK